MKLFSCSTQLSMKFVLLINLKLPKNYKIISCYTWLSFEISLLINMKMPTFVGIFLFIRRENFMHSWFEHEKKKNKQKKKKKPWGLITLMRSLICHFFVCISPEGTFSNGLIHLPYSLKVQIKAAADDTDSFFYFAEKIRLVTFSS